MPEYNLDQLEELETEIVPLLERRGIQVEAIQPIGLLGRGATSSVFSVLINHRYHVLKVCGTPANFDTELRNLRRLLWPPKVVLISRHFENSLGVDLMITEVPQGREMNSDDLSETIMNKLADQLLDLHRLRRRLVDPGQVASRLDRLRAGALAAAAEFTPDLAPDITAVWAEAAAYLKKHQAHFAVKKSLIHGDLWWSNIIVSHDEVYLIDWESLATRDYLEDIARFRVMLDYFHLHESHQRSFWTTRRNPAAANRFVQGIINRYRTDLPDPGVDRRFKFYLALRGFIYLRDLGEWTKLHPSGLDKIQLAATDIINFWHHGLDAGADPAENFL